MLVSSGRGPRGEVPQSEIDLRCQKNSSLAATVRARNFLVVFVEL